MGWFNKKKEKKPQNSEENVDEVEAANKKISKNVYTVYLKEKTGGTVATFAVLKNVKRWFDDETEIPYLRGKGFLEVFPAQESSLTHLNKGKIEKNINDLKEKVKKIKEINDPEEVIKKYGNPENIEFDLKKEEANLRALKYDSRSYMTFGMGGEKEFTFLREGSHYIPQAVDTDTYTAFYPPDSKKKTFGFTHRNKKEKYGMKALMTAAQAGSWIFGLIFLFGSAYLFFQAYDMYSTSEINEARAMCVTTGAQTVELVKQQAVTINEITNTLKDQLRPQSTIEGVAPR